MNIHIIQTGGTIGSERRRDGVLSARRDGRAGLGDIRPENAGDGGNGISGGVPILPEGCGDFRFSYSRPFEILSENMNPDFWTGLIGHIRSLDFARIGALFITHGTDTLAFTSNLLALLLYGIDPPVFLISSDRPRADARANGTAHFDAALRAARDGIGPGVYVPYRNADGRMHLHAGERLLQPADFSDDFTSVSHPAVNDPSRVTAMIREARGREEGDARPLLYAIRAISARIAAIRPYPGIRYDAYDLANTDAILHGAYHSFTASDTDIPPYSLTAFARRAHEKKIEVCFAPILTRPEKTYESTQNLLRSGLIRPLYDMSFEMAYAYLSLRSDRPPDAVDEG
ncbi:MAG: asparaginase domain-containing protein [Clostridiales Family XIII bacterium]|jgi:L-asparaginase|nr:asparaginase domain-containing protein [Clostridiales Family XIII bacterium]